MAVIPSSLLERIRNRAEEAYPEECCGFLTGFVEGEGSTTTWSDEPEAPGAARELEGDEAAATATTVRVLEEIPARNAADEEDRRREFLVEPKDLLNVMKSYRDRDEDVVGFYHSHPDHEAELSPTDLKFARLWPRTVWLIVPVAGIAGQERAWWLQAGGRTSRDATREPESGQEEMDNVQEMIIRSSATAERAITPREERA